MENGGGEMLESVTLIDDPLSTTANLDVQSGSWSTASGATTLLGVGGGVRNPDGVGDAFHLVPTWGVAVDVSVEVSVNPLVVSNDVSISAGIGFGPASAPVNSDEGNSTIPFLGLSAGVSLCAMEPFSSPASFSLVNILYMRNNPSPGVFKDGISAAPGFHELRLLLTLGQYHVWYDDTYLGSSNAQLSGDVSRIHLWGQSNHASTPHVFWRNLRVKTFPLGITPPEEP